MIKQINGEETINDYEAPASTAFDFNDVVTKDSNGRLALATGTTPRSELLGLIQATIASTDDDYASVKTVPVSEFRDPEAEYLADVDTGTAVLSQTGLYDLNDENGINLTSQGQKCIRISRILSTSLVRVKFVTGGSSQELRSITQTLAVADFTDNADATGEIDLDHVIPAGAVVVRTLVKSIVGFAGDTTATFQVGDGTDVDRYSTGTPSCFTTAVAGVDAGAVSGTAFHATAKTPTLTVTGGSDFTDIVTDGNGSIEVTIFYYEA